MSDRRVLGYNNIGGERMVSLNNKKRKRKECFDKKSGRKDRRVAVAVAAAVVKTFAQN